MSVIAVSESLGSLGIEIGREVAARLGYEFAERDIISKAADRYGADLSRLSHAAEARGADLAFRSTARSERLRLPRRQPHRFASGHLLSYDPI